MDSLVCSRVTLSVPPQALNSLSAGRRAVRCSSALLFTAAALLPGATHKQSHSQYCEAQQQRQTARYMSADKYHMRQKNLVRFPRKVKDGEMTNERKLF